MKGLLKVFTSAVMLIGTSFATQQDVFVIRPDNISRFFVQTKGEEIISLAQKFQKLSQRNSDLAQEKKDLATELKQYKQLSSKEQELKIVWIRAYEEQNSMYKDVSLKNESLIGQLSEQALLIKQLISENTTLKDKLSGIESCHQTEICIIQKKFESTMAKSKGNYQKKIESLNTNIAQIQKQFDSLLKDKQTLEKKLYNTKTELAQRDKSLESRTDTLDKLKLAISNQQKKIQNHIQGLRKEDNQTLIDFLKSLIINVPTVVMPNELSKLSIQQCNDFFKRVLPMQEM